MKHDDFRIGLEFAMGGNRWRCTDVGTRTVAAIKLDKGDDTSWYNGPPYPVAEHCLDEDDIEECEPAQGRWIDATGNSAAALASMAERSTIERAFELARSGSVRDVEELIRIVTKEGYEGVPSHLAGREIRRQLRALIQARTPES